MAEIAPNGDVIYYCGDVRPSEVDSQKIVHNTAYLNWAETARFNFMKNIGLDVFKLGELGIDLVVRSMNIDYKSSLVAEDSYIVTSNINVISPLKFEMINQIFCGEKLCVVVTVLACPIDRETKKPNKKFIKENLSKY